MDIVITDLAMPNMDGMQLCRYIRQDLGRRHIPIIVLTAMSDHSEILEVFKAGASDYLVKPFAKEELLARIHVHIERNKAVRELSKTIELLKLANEKIERMSILDPLTGCYNRGYLTSRIEIEIKRSIRYGKPLSIVLSDIDRFKKINDSYGHHAGDAVLVRFAEILKSVVRSEVDWVTRFGGKEFLIILPETSVSDAEIVAEKLRRAVSLEPICWEAVRISVTSSFGVTGIDPAPQPDLPSWEQLLRIADRNLYQAKKEGRNRVIGSLLSSKPS
jgi:diguanylate cyclase (GGDEF)-like protein